MIDITALVDFQEVFSYIKDFYTGYRIWKEFGPKPLPSIGKTDLEGSTSPLSQFRGQDVVVFVSSLFAPKEFRTPRGTMYFLYSTSGDQLNPVSTGCHVTGVEDAVGLARVTAALVQHDSRVKFELDRESPELRNNHLVLIGGPDSNPVGRLLYKEHVTEDRKFLAPNGAIRLGETEYSSGECAWLCSMPNPFNVSKRVLWLAGLGPFGTGAAIEYLVSHFTSLTPANVQTAIDWTVFVQGVPTQTGKQGTPIFLSAKT